MLRRDFNIAGMGSGVASQVRRPVCRPLTLPLVGLMLAGLSMLDASPIEACDVPVFRYVLERFGTDSQDFVIFHRGPLPPDAKQSVDAIQKLTGGPQSPFAIRVRLVDLAGVAGKKPANGLGDTKSEPPAYHGRPTRTAASKPDWVPPADATLPLLAVMPTGGELAAPLWSGSLQGVDVRALIDSPVRRELVQRLFKGDSAIFVLLQSGKPEADATTEKLLRTTLAEQEKKLVLPPRDGPSSLLTKFPLKIAFSVLSVAKNDASERFLVQMLQNLSEPAGPTTGPIVFPVFGRGRILTALAGESLRAETVQEICEFLCGECSCNIKGQVPGVDLLMAVDWDAKLANEAIHADAPATPALAAVATAASSATKSEPPVTDLATNPPTPAGDAPPGQAAPSRSGPLIWTLLAVLAGGVGLVLVGTLAVKTMRRGGDQ